MSDFELGGRPYVELHNLLKLLGLCPSGGAAKAVIDGGEVTVDGKVERRKRRKVLAGQVVEFGGNRVTVNK